MTTIQDFVLQITSIQFDFDGYEWASDFGSQEEWIDYQQCLTSQYQSFSILFEGYEAPDPDELRARGYPLVQLPLPVGNGRFPG